MLIEVIREALSPCFGTMTVNGKWFGNTMERPWADNRNGISCIPAGEYAVKITMSARFKKEMIQVMDVPGRAGIRIHCANIPEELEGCIASALIRIGPEHIYKCNVPKLFAMVKEAIGRGEAVKIKIINPKEIKP